MPVLLCGHFAFSQFWRPWCSEQTLFSKKTNRLFIKHFQCFARNFPNRGSPESVTAIRKLKCTNPLKKQPAVNALTKASVRKTLQMPQLFAAAVLQCRFWIRILCRKKNANSAGFKTGRNAAITQSKRNATLLFEAQFAFSNSVPHFFSLPHMMFILCFWRFLRFWAQNTPNPTRFCTFAPFSGLERWHRAENSPFST